MNLYIVRYWKPFPSSEYGGNQGYVASSRNELHKMIVEDIENDEWHSLEDIESVVYGIVLDAKVFPLSDTMTTGKQFEFTT